MAGIYFQDDAYHGLVDGRGLGGQCVASRTLIAEEAEACFVLTLRVSLVKMHRSFVFENRAFTECARYSIRPRT